MKKILLIVAGLFLGVAGFTAHQAKAQTSTSSALTLEGYCCRQVLTQGMFTV